DAEVVSNAVSAAHDLAPVSRCADVGLLKSAIRLPKDERTLQEVKRLRRSMAELTALEMVGKLRQSVAQGLALRSDVEATGYKPLLANLLQNIGRVESSLDPDPSRSELLLLDSFALAEASGDDVAAAKAAASLVYLVGFRLGRTKEAEVWLRLGHAILDRIGAGQEVVRSELLGNEAAIRIREGDFEGARLLVNRA